MTKCKIDVRDLVFEYPAFKLGPITLHFAAGSRTAILGPSGCGKTSLLRCLADLEEARSGNINFSMCKGDDGKTIVPIRDKRIGFVFQDGGLWPHMTVARHLRFVDPLLTDDEVAALLDRVGLTDCESRRPQQLSGGERQRLALARALAGSPDVLMLDEPMSSVDAPQRDELCLLISSILDETGITMIVVTHDRDVALALADELILIREGRMVESGPASSILRWPHTLFAATFLSNAASWPARPDGNGLLMTPFGGHPDPSGGQKKLNLVVLPGEVAIAERSSDSCPIGHVLRVIPEADHARATIGLSGRTLEVCCKPSTPARVPLPLKLTSAPRFLPDEEAIAR